MGGGIFTPIPGGGSTRWDIKDGIRVTGVCEFGGPETFKIIKITQKIKKSATDKSDCAFKNRLSVCLNNTLQNNANN